MWADSDDVPQSAAATWERVLDRSWVVIVIDLIFTIFANDGLSAILSQDPLNVIVGTVILLISATLVFADTSGTVDDMPVWWLLPGAFWRSLRVARGTVYLRALAILCLELIQALAQVPLFDWMRELKIASPDFWSSVPLNAITLVPIAALTALVYRDATRKAPDAETETNEIGD